MPDLAHAKLNVRKRERWTFVQFELTSVIDPVPALRFFSADLPRHNAFHTKEEQTGKPMKLEKLSAVAELVSSIAIVETLAYLAVQTNQNTLATHATVRQAMLAEDRELLFKEIDYPHLHPATKSSGAVVRRLESSLPGSLMTLIRWYLRIRAVSVHTWPI